MNSISLKCKCGEVQGIVNHVSPRAGNHVVCYCEDCQAFARYLSKEGGIMDEWGGTEIYQTAPWHINIEKGLQHLRCLRLKPKGLYRWYAGCCNTPVGNTISAKFPFIGLIHSFMEKDEQTAHKLGPVKGYHKLESAIGEVPEAIRKVGMPKGMTLVVIWSLLKWRFTGGDKPQVFFDESGHTISKPRVLNN
jgi:hypothetical protein